MADAVGATGFVLGLDSADPTYGAPKTLGECTEEILKSERGGQIEFQLQTDFVTAAEDLKDSNFDAVVLTHSAWYFASESQLLDTFRAAIRVAPTLYLAEWKLEIDHLDQLPHMLAIFIQHGLAHHSLAEANVRTPASSCRFKELLAEAGWNIAEELQLDTSGMQDADWEIDICLAMLKDTPEQDKGKQAVYPQVQLLEQLRKPSGNSPLSCFAITAKQLN